MYMCIFITVKLPPEIVFFGGIRVGGFLGNLIHYVARSIVVLRRAVVKYQYQNKKRRNEGVIVNLTQI